VGWVNAKLRLHMQMFMDLYDRHVQPFSLAVAGQFRILESYRGPHQFLLDAT